MRRRAIALGSVASLALGCGTAQEGQLFRSDVPGVSRFVVGNSSASTTRVDAQLVDGTTCEGRLSRTGPGTVPPDDYAVPGTPDTDSGVAVLNCRSDAVLRCHLSRRVGEGYSFGTCQDQHGVKYTLVF